VLTVVVAIVMVLGVLLYLACLIRTYIALTLGAMAGIAAVDVLGIHNRTVELTGMWVAMGLTLVVMVVAGMRKSS
jgi:hypothetical protein